jgi:hypothetical protein
LSSGHERRIRPLAAPGDETSVHAVRVRASGLLRTPGSRGRPVRIPAGSVGVGAL